MKVALDERDAPHKPSGVSGLLLLAALVGVAVVAGRATHVMGPVLPLLGGVALLAAVGATLAILTKGYKVFWTFLICVLIGYQMFGKGFAYVGAAPLFVGEMALGLGALTAILVVLAKGFRLPGRLRRPEVAVLLVFMAWQLAQTIPYVSRYKLETFRDAVVWGYAFFALFILVTVPREGVDRFLVFYRRLLVFLLLWWPIAFVLVRVVHVPARWPGSPVPFMNLKTGDVGVHLGAIGAFLLLRLDQCSKPWSIQKVWLLWIGWGLSWVLWCAGGTRGSMLSSLLAVGVVVFWRPRTRWDRPIILVAFALALISIVTVLPLPETFPDPIANLRDNVVSIVGEGSERDEGTVQWRLRWWKAIVGYTFGGPYFWGGKGYGLNVGLDDSFVLLRREVLNRSPHNVSMTFLSRSGVPGFTLWLLFLFTMIWMLIKRTRAAKVAGAPPETRYSVWLLAYLLAFLMNASVDVFLEGPMGGIWFWSLIGMILVYLPPARYVLRIPEPSLEPGLRAPLGEAST